jgi:hypothetical protein
MTAFQPKIDDVAAFGGPKIPSAFFSADWTEAKRNAVTSQGITVVQQVEPTFMFDDENGVRARSARCL